MRGWEFPCGVAMVTCQAMAVELPQVSGNLLGVEEGGKDNWKDPITQG